MQCGQTPDGVLVLRHNFQEHVAQLYRFSKNSSHHDHMMHIWQCMTNIHFFFMECQLDLVIGLCSHCSYKKVCCHWIFMVSCSHSLYMSPQGLYVTSMSALHPRCQFWFYLLTCDAKCFQGPIRKGWRPSPAMSSMSSDISARMGWQLVWAAAGEVSFVQQTFVLLPVGHCSCHVSDVSIMYIRLLSA